MEDECTGGMRLSRGGSVKVRESCLKRGEEGRNSKNL